MKRHDSACPHCGTPEQARIVRCRSCGEAFASRDLMELHQLEFLLEETAAWGVAETLRSSYAERLKALKNRMLRPEPEPPGAEAAPAPVPMPEPATVAPKPSPHFCPGILVRPTDINISNPGMISTKYRPAYRGRL